MTEKPKNHPAFPFPYNDKGNFGPGPSTGMSLRDWFAGMAVVGMGDAWASEGNSPDDIAEYSYDQADARVAAAQRLEIIYLCPDFA